MALRDWYVATPSGGWDLLAPHPATGLPSAWPPPIEPDPEVEVFAFEDAYSRYVDGTSSGISLKGQPWAVFGGNGQGGTVVGGLFDSTSTSAAYLESNLGKRVTRLGAEFMFDDKGGTLTDSGTLCLVSWADGGIVAQGFGRRTSAHVTITQNAAQWYVRTALPGSNAAVTLLSTKTLPKRLAPNVLHRVDVKVDYASGIGEVIFGDGTSFAWADPRIGGYNDETFACWEPFYSGNAKASRVRIARTWANTEKGA